jgi:hypothetical protein
MKKFYSLVLLLAALVCTNMNVKAQCDPILRNDSSQLIFNGAITTSTKVGNTVYVGGGFTQVARLTGGFTRVEGLTTGNIINLGSWPRVNGTVNAIVSDGAGGWIIGGAFTQVGSSARNRIAHINAVGQVTTWNPDANGQVFTLFRSGTTIYAGGSFTTIGGQSRNRVAALDATTGLATSWNPGASSTVNSLNVSGGLVYVGGAFTTIGGQTRNRLAAIDATTGLATSWNPNVTGTTVNKILINGTTAYIGGNFSSVNSVARSNAAAVDITTGIQTTWNPSPNGVVYDILLNGSNVLVAGVFTTIGSLSRTAVGEVDNNLGNATSRNFGLTSGTAIVLKLSGNSLYVAGSFTAGSSLNLARLNMTTNTVDSWQSNFNTTVWAMEMVGSTLYVGGAFTQQTKSRTYAAAFDYVADTLLPWAPVLNNTVTAIAANQSTVYLGGNFSTVNGNTRSRLASVSSTNAAISTWNPAPNSTVNSMLLNGNTLYVGGGFSSIASQSRGRAAAFDITTDVLTNWNPNISNGTVAGMAISGTNMYLAGTFTTVNLTNTRNRAASVSLSAATLNGWNPDLDGAANTIAASGSNIYIGGAFVFVNGTTQQPRLAAFDATTGIAASWSPYPNGTINSIAIDGGLLYAAGSYLNNGGQPRTNLSAVSLATGNATAWDPAPNTNATYVAVYGDRLLVSGTYTTISGQSNTPIATQYNLLQTNPVVTITGKDNICAGTSVTYTATTTVVGATYQWKKNNINVGTASTYTTIPVNGDQIQCVITVPGGSCYTTATATSNTITVTISAPITPTISISGNNTVCSGTPTTYTATTNITGGTLQWAVNGNNVGTNSTTFIYTPSNGDVVACKIIPPSTGCYSSASVTSTPINVTVTAPVLPTISISATNTTICANTSVTFNITTNVTGGTYQWNKNSSPIPGATASTYNTTTLANGDIITCTITIPAGGCFTASTATSNDITMTVNTNITSTLTISGNTTPCIGANTTYTANTNMAGGTYQWKVNNINVGTNSSTYAYVPVTGDVVTCVVTAASGTCYVPATRTSNALTINPQSAVTPTATVNGSNNICAGSNGSYFVSTNVIGGTYQWKVNNINAGTNSPNYNYVPVNGDVITCTVTVPGTGCYSAPNVTSAGFTVTVNNPALPTISISTPSTTVCSGVLTTYSSTSNVTGGTYQWRVNGINALGAVNPAFSYFPSNGDVVTCLVTIPVGGCFLASSSLSNPITMTVTPSVVPTISIAASANNVCAGTVVNFSSTTNVTGATYQWQVNSTNVGTSSTYSYAPVDGDIVRCVITVPSTGCYTSATVSSTSIIMTINAPVVPAITVAADADTVCEGNNVILTATTNVTGGTYLWKVNGFNAGTNSPTHTYVPQNNDIILCTIIAPPGCFTTTTATSQLKVLKTKPKSTVTFALGAAPIVEIGATVYVSTTVPAGITNYSIAWKNKGTTFATTTVPNASYTKAAGIDTVTATLTTSDGCYAESTTPEIYVHSAATGIGTLMDGANGITVYPNPFNDRFTIKGITTGDQVAVVDMTGKLLQKQIITASNQQSLTIFINDLPAGAYMLRVSDKNAATKANIPLRKL